MKRGDIANFRRRYAYWLVHNFPPLPGFEAAGEDLSDSGGSAELVELGPTPFDAALSKRTSAQPVGAQSLVQTANISPISPTDSTPAARPRFLLGSPITLKPSKPSSDRSNTKSER